MKLCGIEFCSKYVTSQVIVYDTRARIGKQKKFEDNAWFVGYAPRRNPEIVVSVLVQESGKHGGEAAGPVVRDVIKAYYDKKNKKTPGQYTAQTRPPESLEPQPQQPAQAGVTVPRVALKTHDTASATVARTVSGRER